MANHATVRLGSYTIPLIGIDPAATREQCDRCHDRFHFQSVQLNPAGNQWLCEKCMKQGPMENLLDGLSQHAKFLTKAELKTELSARGIDVDSFLKTSHAIIAKHKKQKRKSDKPGSL